MMKKTALLLFGLCGLVLQTYGQNQLVTTVPFKLNHDHMIVKIRINDSEPLNFLFDSGAGGTLIAKSVADSLGLSPSLARTNTGAAGTHKVGLVRGTDIHVGDATINSVTVMRDHNDMEELDNGETVAGIIGFHILSRFVVHINFDNNQLYLYNRGNFKYDGGGVSLPIILNYNIPTVEASLSLKGQKPLEGMFLVDTGARSDLLISSPTVEKYNMPDHIGDHYVLRTKVGSSQKKVKIMYGRLSSFEFADQQFDDVPVVLSSTTEGVLSFEDFDGIIGNRILQRFNITFDYQRNTMYLEPGKKIKNGYQINASGFSIYFKKGVPFVKDIIDRSPARKAGLKEDDQIISMNGELVETLEKQEIRNTFFRPGTVVKMVVLRGVKFKYTEIQLEELI